MVKGLDTFQKYFADYEEPDGAPGILLPLPHFCLAS